MPPFLQTALLTLGTVISNTFTTNLIPTHVLSQHKPGKRHEDQQRNNLLQDLQLVTIQELKTNPVRRDLKPVFKKSDSPGDAW